MIFVFFNFIVVGVVADGIPSQPSLVRFWGLLENEDGEMVNCNLLDSSNPPKMISAGNDITYNGVVGFSGRYCYYSIDVLASDVSQDDILKVQLEDIYSSSFVYDGDDSSPFHSDVTIELDSSYFVFIDGCMDSDAINFNPSATFDDGSCEYFGCMDPNANNYNALATINESCTYDDEENNSYIPSDVYGCLDSSAVNFNQNATIDDGSCEYTGCMDISASNYDATATVDDGSCVYPDETQEQEESDTTGTSTTSTSTTSDSSTTKSTHSFTSSESWNGFPEDSDDGDDEAEDSSETSSSNDGGTIENNEKMVTTSIATVDASFNAKDETNEQLESDITSGSAGFFSLVTGNVVSALKSKQKLSFVVLFFELLVVIGVLLTATILFSKRKR